MQIFFRFQGVPFCQDDVFIPFQDLVILERDAFLRDQTFAIERGIGHHGNPPCFSKSVARMRIYVNDFPSLAFHARSVV